jgi:hypothetical protein
MNIPRHRSGASNLICSVVGLLWGCNSQTGDSGLEQEAGCEHCYLSEANIPTWDITVSVPTYELCDGCDLSMDWSGLSTDLLGQSITPSDDIETVTLYVFEPSPTEDLLDGLVSNTLDQSLLVARWTCDSAKNRSSLSDCAFVGHPLVPSEYFIEGWGQWLLLLNGGSPSRLRTMVFMNPTPSSVQAELELVGQSSVIEGGMDGSAAQPIRMKEDVELIVDWSELSKDSWGATLRPSVLDVLQLDRLEVSASEAAGQILSLDSLSQERWSGDVLGSTQASLASLQGPRPFPGIEPESTWFLTAWCSTCDLELPVFATWIESY